MRNVIQIVKKGYFFAEKSQKFAQQTHTTSGGWGFRPQTLFCDTFELHLLAHRAA